MPPEQIALDLLALGRGRKQIRQEEGDGRERVDARLRIAFSILAVNPLRIRP